MNVSGKTYIFNRPLIYLIEEEDGFFVVNNEMLGIIGTGKTKYEVENNFKEEFNFLYDRLNLLTDDKLGKYFLNLKTIMKDIVKEVIISQKVKTV